MIRAYPVIAVAHSRPESLPACNVWNVHLDTDDDLRRRVKHRLRRQFRTKVPLHYVNLTPIVHGLQAIGIEICKTKDKKKLISPLPMQKQIFPTNVPL